MTEVDDAYQEVVDKWRADGFPVADTPIVPDGYTRMGIFAMREYKGHELPFQRLTVMTSRVLRIGNLELYLSRRALPDQGEPDDAETPFALIELYLLTQGYTHVYSVTRIKSIVLLGRRDTYSACLLGAPGCRP